MLKIFQRNMALQMVLTIAVLLLLWLRPLLSPPAITAGDHPALLYSLLSSWLAPTPRLAVVIAMLLTLAEGMMLNMLLSSIGLVSQNSLLPTLLFIVAAGAGATTLTPMVIVWAALIGCLNQLMLRSTLLTIPSSKICGATALIGIASMFYLPAAVMMLSYLLVAVNYRLYNWKDWAVMLLGFIAPYLTLAAVLFITGDLAQWWDSITDGLGDISVTLGSFTLPQALGAAMLLFIMLWGLLNVMLHLGEHPVVWQKNASTVMLFFVGALCILLYAPVQSASMQLIAVPFAFCTTLLLLGSTPSTTSLRNRKRRLWIYDTLLILIIIAAIAC